MLDKREHKSAVRDHADRRNCVRDWKWGELVERETNRSSRWIKQAIYIRKMVPLMKRGEGGYRLSHVWDSLLATSCFSHVARNSKCVFPFLL